MSRKSLKKWELEALLAERERRIAGLEAGLAVALLRESDLYQQLDAAAAVIKDLQGRAGRSPAARRGRRNDGRSGT